MANVRSKRINLHNAAVRVGLLAVSSAIAGSFGETSRAQTLVYTGADPSSPGTFDTTSTNFSYLGVATRFNSSDSVVFDDTASGPATVIVSGTNVNPVSVTFNNSNVAYVFNAGGGMVTGSTTPLFVEGGGSVTLNQSNSYGGQTNVSLGTLTVGSTGSIGTGDLNVATVVNLNNASQRVGALNGAGTVTLNTTTLQISPVTSGIFGGSITGTGNILLNGSQTFTGTIAFNGSFNVSGGTSLIPSTLSFDSGASITATYALNHLNVGGTATGGSAVLNIQNGATISIGSGGVNIANQSTGGLASDTGILNIIGDSSSLITNGNVYLGSTATTGATNASATINMTSGTLQSTNSGSTVYIGYGNLSTGVINQSGGNATLSAIQLGLKAGSSGTYNLSGGTLNVLTINPTASAGSSTLVCNGGTLNLLRAYSNLGSSLQVVIGPGGMNVTSLNAATGQEINATINLYNVSSGVVGGTDGGITIDPNSGNGNIFFHAHADYTGPTSTPGSVTFVNSAPVTLLGNITIGNNLNAAASVSLTFFSANNVTLGGNNTFPNGVLAQGKSGAVLTFLPQSNFTGNVEVQQGGFNLLGMTNSGNGLQVDDVSTGNPSTAGSLLLGANNASGGIYTRYTGPLFISDGAVKVATAGSTATRTLLLPASLYMNISGGSAFNFFVPTSAILDLTNNDLVDPGDTGTQLATDTFLAKRGYNNGTWTGVGLTSSTAATNTTRLTALGVILNSTDPNGINSLYGNGTAMGLFDGFSPQALDVLIKYTYYGDANLDGKVDGSDYTRIDNGYLLHLSGWYNGDFNYDGFVNGSDYTLMDNAFNTQGAALASSVASVTDQIAVVATVAVPEPTSLALFTSGVAALLGRRRRVKIHG